eukprot:TRINITY_DN9335_c0_g2_i1.p1 TRINITY_DN9335_c0_g2~~TRINITY_DN9335_c0_g2_i1.p1  ORF type:complete len:365 (-),score=67.55 TRINITY_DN9335_c0_g2_i1:80-1174(-)
MTEPAELAQDIHWKKHKNFLHYCLTLLPHPYQSQDSNRITLAFFVIGALDLIDCTEKINKTEIIDWVYSLQILPSRINPSNNVQNCGWRGSPFFVQPPIDELGPHPLDKSHVAMTYVALGLLLMMGDDLSRVEKASIAASLKFIQQPDGSFCPTTGGCESDMRYIFCASCVAYMINDWSGFDKERATQYIVRSQSYDFSIAQGPAQEGHAGSTFCAIASLSLMGTLDQFPYKEKLVKWLIMRQGLGFCGRPNKKEDTCYSFWVGATLSILGAFSVVDSNHSRCFTLGCQQSVGGCAKWSDCHPDVLHTYMSFCGLSFGEEPGFLPVNATLCLPQRAADRLNEIYENDPTFVPLHDNYKTFQSKN